MKELIYITALFYLCSSAVASAVVYPKIINARGVKDEKLVSFSTFDKDYTLRLRPFDIFKPGAVAIRLEENGITEEKIENMQRNGKLYFDPENAAFLHLDESNGRTSLEGIIGNKYKLSPSKNENTDRNAHDFMEVENLAGSLKDAKLSRDDIGSSKFGLWWWWGGPIESIDAVVEVAVVSDKEHCSNFPQMIDLVNYVSVVFVAANYPYYKIANSNVTLAVVAIICNMNEAYQPYVQENLSGDKLRGRLALEDFANYMEENKLSPGYDMGLLLTGLDIVSNSGATNLSGLAYSGGVCSNERYAIVQDLMSGLYLCVRGVIEEISHCCCITDDGEGSISSLPGHPSAEDCPKSDGYFMGNRIKQENNYRFSSCSVKQLEYCIDNKACLKELAPSHYDLGTKLPGQVLTKQEYCDKRNPGSVLNETSETRANCKISCCDSANGNIICHVYPALDGADCSRYLMKICRNGLCVNEY